MKLGVILLFALLGALCGLCLGLGRGIVERPGAQSPRALNGMLTRLAGGLSLAFALALALYSAGLPAALVMSAAAWGAYRFSAPRDLLPLRPFAPALALGVFAATFFLLTEQLATE